MYIRLLIWIINFDLDVCSSIVCQWKWPKWTAPQSGHPIFRNSSVGIAGNHSGPTSNFPQFAQREFRKKSRFEMGATKQQVEDQFSHCGSIVDDCHWTVARMWTGLRGGGRVGGVPNEWQSPIGIWRLLSKSNEVKWPDAQAALIDRPQTWPTSGPTSTGKRSVERTRHRHQLRFKLDANWIPVANQLGRCLFAFVTGRGRRRLCNGIGDASDSTSNICHPHQNRV